MKKIITLILTVAIIVVALGAITSIFGKETERISSFEFSRGALDKRALMWKQRKVYIPKICLNASVLP